MKWKLALLKYTRGQWDDLFSVAGVGRKSNNGVNFHLRRLQIDVGRSSLAAGLGRHCSRFPKEVMHGIHRITDPLKLGKISKIIKSNHQPSTTRSIPVSPSATCTGFLNTPRHGSPTAALQGVWQCWTALSVRSLFLIPDLNLPWCSLGSDQGL